MISSVFQCILELIVFALKSIGILLLFDVVSVNVTLGFILPLFFTIFGDKTWRGKNTTNYLDT